MTADIIAEIVKSRPPRLSFSTSGTLNELIRMMLEKDAAKRHQSARGLLIDLKALKRHFEIEKRTITSTLSSGEIGVLDSSRIGQAFSLDHDTADQVGDMTFDPGQAPVFSQLAEEMSRNSRLEAENEALTKDNERQQAEIQHLTVRIEELVDKLRARDAQILSLNNSHANDERSMEMLRLELYETTKELNRTKQKLAAAGQHT